MTMMNNMPEYDVVISFAGEDRQVAEKIARGLTDSGVTVFYDRYEEANLWGKDLYTHLSTIYRDKGKFCLMIISSHYAMKQWTNHERKSAQARAFCENMEYILPLRLDSTKIEGLNETVGYVDLSRKTVQEVVELIQAKLNQFSDALVGNTQKEDVPSATITAIRSYTTPSAQGGTVIAVAFSLRNDGKSAVNNGKGGAIVLPTISDPAKIETALQDLAREFVSRENEIQMPFFRIAHGATTGFDSVPKALFAADFKKYTDRELMYFFVGRIIMRLDDGTEKRFGYGGATGAGSPVILACSDDVLKILEAP
jgi:hypothetical protein